MCDAVEGRFLSQPTVEGLHSATQRAQADGVDAVFVTDGSLGDAIVLAAALGTRTPGVLVGVRVGLTAQSHRHPTALAREMTTLDLVCGGRTVLALMGPFTDATMEVVTLCRDMWRNGVAIGEGPYFPVPGAINRPGPHTEGGPPIALDLTDGSPAPPEFIAQCDLLLILSGASAPPALPSQVVVCQILDT